jgi:aminoglycoside phosphotransferase (APT) family kinase protein
MVDVRGHPNFDVFLPFTLEVLRVSDELLPLALWPVSHDSHPGPTQYITAREVATVEILPCPIGIPVPCVIAWSSCASTPKVGAEFALMEKASGRPLHDMAGESLHSPVDVRLRVHRVPESDTAHQITIRFTGYYFLREITPNSCVCPYS